MSTELQLFLLKHLMRFHPPSVFLKNTHIQHAHTDPHLHNHAHIQTLKTNTQTPPNTPPTVTTSEEWSACGEVVVKEFEGKWELGKGDTVLLLTLRRLVISRTAPGGTQSGQYKLMGTCVFRGPCAASLTILICGKWLFYWAEARMHLGRGRHEANHAACSSSELS